MVDWYFPLICLCAISLAAVIYDVRTLSWSCDLDERARFRSITHGRLRHSISNEENDILDHLLLRLMDGPPDNSLLIPISQSPRILPRFIEFQTPVRLTSDVYGGRGFRIPSKEVLVPREIPGF
jgi:hypothetical protein